MIRNFLVNLVNDFPSGKKTFQMIKVVAENKGKSVFLRQKSFESKIYQFISFSFHLTAKNDQEFFVNLSCCNFSKKVLPC